MAFRLSLPRVKRDNVSRWHFSWFDLREVQRAIEKADGQVELAGRALRREREAYEESREQEKKE